MHSRRYSKPNSVTHPSAVVRQNPTSLVPLGRTEGRDPPRSGDSSRTCDGTLFWCVAVFTHARRDRDKSPNSIYKESAISKAMQPVGIGGVNHRLAGMR